MKRFEERVYPKNMRPTNGMLIEHQARYDFVKSHCKGRVLDIACGSGYGADHIHNPQVTGYVGVDIDAATVAYATEHYGGENRQFLVGDALDKTLPSKLGTFDVIISFETIEHFHGDRQFLQTLYDLLVPGGTLFISTPFGRGVGQPCTCPYHVHQYTEAEFLERLEIFDQVTMYHQVGDTIEQPLPDKRYFLMFAECKKL